MAVGGNGTLITQLEALSLFWQKACMQELVPNQLALSSP